MAEYYIWLFYIFEILSLFDGIALDLHNVTDSRGLEKSFFFEKYVKGYQNRGSKWNKDLFASYVTISVFVHEMKASFVDDR